MQAFFDFYDRWNALVPLVFGIYASLLAFGYLPRKPRDPARLEVWRRKFGPTMRVISPLMVLFGAISLGIALLKDGSPAATAQEFNRSAPRMVDKVTRFDRAIAGPGKSITFEHTVTNVLARQVDINTWMDFSRQLRRNLFKDEVTRRLHRQKVRLLFRYSDVNGALIGELEIAPDDPEPK